MTSDWKPYQRRLEKEVQAMREGHYYYIERVCEACGWAWPGTRAWGASAQVPAHAPTTCPKCGYGTYQVVVVGPMEDPSETCPTCGRTLYDLGYGAYHHCPGAK